MSFKFISMMALTAGLGLGVAQANEFAGPLRDVAIGPLAAFTVEPMVLDALRQQNAANADLSQTEIDAMDLAWRAEVATAARPMIDDLLTRSGSAWLRAQKDSLGGLVTEVIVTDALGLNALQSDVTSDYWQGDEAKWTESYGKPSGTVHLGEVELDESTQTYQSQVSMPINDPATGAPLGAITVGINLEALQ